MIIASSSHTCASYLLTQPARCAGLWPWLTWHHGFLKLFLSQTTTLKSKKHTQSLSVVPPATDSIAVNGCFTDPAGGMWLAGDKSTVMKCDIKYN